MSQAEELQTLPPAENRYVSTAQVAQALGVSVTTVKRWVDDAILPAHRTAGGHRKLLMSDVIRLVREGNLPYADLTRLLPKKAFTQSDPVALHRQLCDAIAAREMDQIRTLLHAGYRAGIPIETLADRVISPALASVGHQWALGRMDVMTEHRVTQSCISAMYELRSFLMNYTDKSRPVAVGGAPEHDHYVLPSLLAKLTLLDGGWDAINLGPHSPLEAFHTAVTELSPQLVWLSVSHLRDAEKFLTDYRKLYQLCEEHKVAVAIGGSGLPEALRVKMPYTSFGDGMTQLAAFARSLHSRPVRPKRGRPPGAKTDAEDRGA